MPLNAQKLNDLNTPSTHDPLTVFGNLDIALVIKAVEIYTTGLNTLNPLSIILLHQARLGPEQYCWLCNQSLQQNREIREGIGSFRVSSS